MSDLKWIEIRLSKKRTSKIDIDDLEEVTKWKWSLKESDGIEYAYRKGNVYLHRFLLRAKRGQIIDHVNGDGLDNRRQNLRFCTHAQNQWNSNKRNWMKTKGIRRRTLNSWQANIRVGDGKRIYLGSFSSEAAAQTAYNLAAKKYHGDFAWSR